MKDKYAWLKDTTRTNRKVLDFLKKENQRTKDYMKDTEHIQKQIYNEILELIPKNYKTYPYKYGTFYYFELYEEDKEFPKILRKKTLKSKKYEEILDWNQIASKSKNFYPGGWEVDKKGKFLAFSYDTSMGENFSLHIRDIQTGEIVDSIPKVFWDEFLWIDEGKILYVVEKEDTKRPYKVMLHELGKSYKDDIEVFKEEDDRYFVHIYDSLDGYVFVECGNTKTSFAYLLYPYFKEILPKKEGVKFKALHRNGEFFILTNENAPNYKVLKMDERGNIEEFIPENGDIFIEDFEVFKDFMALEVRKNGIKSILIYLFDEKTFKEIKFNEEAYFCTLQDNYEYDTHTLRISYSSLKTPQTIYEYDVKSSKLYKRWTVPIPKYNPKNYEVKRIWATSYDGTRIPISLLYHKTKFKKNRKHPVYLIGYGAYGYPIDPEFMRGFIPIVNRGFALAIAHIRGGGEFGEKWHDEGKLLKKKNSIYDILECAEYLIVDGWTEKGKIVLQGASAGGIVVGGALNIKPYLFGAVVALVPFVDVLNTMLDPKLPLTIQEYDEWGNPNEKIFYDYIKSYSPYENVKPNYYPPILAYTGLHDPRVGYWEPAKWILKLRENNLSESPILLWTAMDEGHLGKAGRYEAYKEKAFILSFVLKALKGNWSF